MLTGQSGDWFSYACEFRGIASTRLPIENYYEPTSVWEMLEAYQVQQCSDYPNTNFTAMAAIDVQTVAGSQLSWVNQGKPALVTTPVPLSLLANISGPVGVLTVMDSPTASQRPYAFVQGSDGNLWLNWWDGSQWSCANQGQPARVNISGPVGVVTVMDIPTASQRPYAFVQGSACTPLLHSQGGPALVSAPDPHPPRANISGPVGVLTVMDNPTASQRPYAFVQGSDGNLWLNWWDGSQWSWANQGKPAGANVSGPVGVLTVMDTPTSPQRPYAFVQGSDGNLWLNWWDGAWIWPWKWANQG